MRGSNKSNKSYIPNFDGNWHYYKSSDEKYVWAYLDSLNTIRVKKFYNDDYNLRLWVKRELGSTWLKSIYIQTKVPLIKCVARVEFGGCYLKASIDNRDWEKFSFKTGGQSYGLYKGGEPETASVHDRDWTLANAIKNGKRIKFKIFTANQEWEVFDFQVSGFELK